MSLSINDSAKIQVVSCVLIWERFSFELPGDSLAGGSVVKEKMIVIKDGGFLFLR